MLSLAQSYHSFYHHWGGGCWFEPNRVFIDSRIGDSILAFVSAHVYSACSLCFSCLDMAALRINDLRYLPRISQQCGLCPRNVESYHESLWVLMGAQRNQVNYHRYEASARRVESHIVFYHHCRGGYWFEPNVIFIDARIGDRILAFVCAMSASLPLCLLSTFFVPKYGGFADQYLSYLPRISQQYELCPRNVESYCGW